MLDPRAVREFKARPLRNSDKAKDFTSRALQRKLDKLDPPPDFSLELYNHQKACFLLCEKNPFYFLSLDMGLGKSAIMASLFRYLWENRRAERMLILVPYATNIPTWERELKKFAPGFDYELLDSDKTTEQKHAQFWGKTEIVVMTYKGLITLLCKRKGAYKDTPKKKLKGLPFEPDPKLIRKFHKHFDMIVCDESTAFKNHQSLTFRILKALRKGVKRLHNLSGMPFGSNPQDLWAQFYAIDQGETLGETLGLFREAFFTQTKNTWGWSRANQKTNWNFDYSLKRSEEDNLYRTLRHSSIRLMSSSNLGFSSKSL